MVEEAEGCLGLRDLSPLPIQLLPFGGAGRMRGKRRLTCLRGCVFDVTPTVLPGE